MNRRRFLLAPALFAAGAFAAPRSRTGPLLCLDSRLLADVDYSQLGSILNGLGFDGCDLDVEPDGTVQPDQSPVDLVRAIEVVTGSMLEVPVATTAFLSINEPWARNVLALCGRSGVVYFRTGYSRRPEQLAQRRNDIAGLISYGRAAGIGVALPYPAAEAIVRASDPEWVGYDFDPSQGNVEAVLPRLRAVILRDVSKESAIDWPAFFTALARARFSGPLTLTSTYPASDRLEAIRRDLAFARQQLNAAFTSLRPSVSPWA